MAIKTGPVNCKNMKNLTVVMYHYVRDLKHSRYPDIKGLDVSLFKDQIAYIKRHYTPVTMQEVIDAFDLGGVKNYHKKLSFLPLTMPTSTTSPRYFPSFMRTRYKVASMRL